MGAGGDDHRGADQQPRRHLCRIVPEARRRHPADYSDYSYFYDQVGYGFYWTDDHGGLANPSQYIQGKDRFKKQSHEIRVATPSDKRLRFIGGVFYQHQKHNITQRYKIDGISYDIGCPATADTIWLTAQQRIDRDYAAFGEATYDITPKLTIMGGIRFFKSDNSLEGYKLRQGLRRHRRAGLLPRAASMARHARTSTSGSRKRATCPRSP